MLHSICGCMGCGLFCLGYIGSSRDYSVYAPSQWEMVLHCNAISHWLGAYTGWSLEFPVDLCDPFTGILQGCFTGSGAIIRDHLVHALSQWEMTLHVTSSLIGWAHTLSQREMTLHVTSSLTGWAHTQIDPWSIWLLRCQWSNHEEYG